MKPSESKFESEAEKTSDRMEVTATSRVSRRRIPRLLRGVLLGWVLPVVVVLIAVQLFVYRGTSVPGFAPQPARGLQDLSSEADLQAGFAQDIGHPRLVLLISPT